MAKKPTPKKKKPAKKRKRHTVSPNTPLKPFKPEVAISGKLLQKITHALAKTDKTFTEISEETGLSMDDISTICHLKKLRSPEKIKEIAFKSLKKTRPARERILKETEILARGAKGGRFWTSINDFEGYREQFTFSHESKRKNAFNSFFSQLKRSKKDVRVLDAGAGFAIALSEMKQALEKPGRKVYAQAVDLGKPAFFASIRRSARKKLKMGGLSGYRETPAEIYNPLKKFDLIVSHAGAVTYSKHPLLLVKGMAEALKPEGQLFMAERLSRETVEKIKRFCQRKNLLLEMERIEHEDFDDLYRMRICHQAKEPNPKKKK